MPDILPKTHFANKAKNSRFANKLVGKMGAFSLIGKMFFLQNVYSRKKIKEKGIHTNP